MQIASMKPAMALPRFKGDWDDGSGKPSCFEDYQRFSFEDLNNHRLQFAKKNHEKALTILHDGLNRQPSESERVALDRLGQVIAAKAVLDILG